MVQISPFRALRYDPAKVGGLSRVLAPPYDVITPEEQTRLYEASPYNIVRLILGREEPTDTERDDRYTRARRAFETWRERGILRLDAQPAIYLFDHAFPDSGGTATRLGFIALLALADSTARAVHRHETTLAAPVRDRAKLLDSVPANLSPIFCIYPDPQGVIQGRLRAHADAAEPDMHARHHQDRVRGWVVTDPRLIEDVRRALGSSPILIADGHHRYAVARSRRRRYGAVMAYFVSMADPGLSIRAIHRVIGFGKRGAIRGAFGSSPRAGGSGRRPAGSPRTRQTPEAVRRLFSLKPVQDVAALSRWLGVGTASCRFGYYDGRRIYQATGRPALVKQWLAHPSIPGALAALDVVFLHHLVLPKLGVDAGAIRYLADASAAVDEINQGRASMAWLLRGLSLAQVFDLASHGITLPPKSTFFFPKVLSGLTIHPFT